MTLTEHLGELRRRLVVCIVAFVATTTICWVFYARILRLFEHPYCVTLGAGHRCTLNVFGPLEAFGVRLDVVGSCGLALASPVVLFELWRFVTPGLKANEKRFALPFVFATVGLFCLGAYVAWLTFPHALGFFHSVGGPGITDIFYAPQYLNLILALMAIFGLTFEFPVVLVALELAHVITPAQLRKNRRYAIIAIVIVSAVITPSSDPFSMLAMAIPMLAFYELSILLGRFARR